MCSRASCVEADDFGKRGHEPYQLRVLCTCLARFGIEDGTSFPPWWIGELMVGAVAADDSVLNVPCEPELSQVGMLVGRLEELASAGFGRSRFLGAMVASPKNVGMGTKKPKLCWQLVRLRLGKTINHPQRYSTVLFRCLLGCVTQHASAASYHPSIPHPMQDPSDVSSRTKS